MKKKTLLKIFLGLVAFVLLIKLLSIAFVEPWVEKIILTALNDNEKNYTVEIDRVHILLIASGIELDGIKIYSKYEHEDEQYLTGEISSIKFKRIKLAKILVKKDINISKVIIFNGSIKSKVPFSREEIPFIVSNLNIRINRILFDSINLEILNTLTGQSYSLNEGVLKVYDLQIKEHDTLTPGILKKFDFEAEELSSVSSDSMYSFKVIGINYSADSSILSVDSLSIHPNYADYDFTSRYEFQTNRIEASFSNIFLYDFNAAGLLLSGSLISSYIKIGTMDMTVFRDNRKEFRHINKVVFQEIIYNYPGLIRIDSIGLTYGKVLCTLHVKGANEPGSIGIDKISAEVYQITNDTIYKTETASLELNSKALLVGKARMTVSLKARLFDSRNTFSVNGNLSGFEADELNPLLEKTAFIYATSGKIDELKFDFTANDTKATGKLTMLYHELYIAVKNRHTDDTTAFRERFISLIVNSKLLDSNPIAGEEVREGIIDYKRDPERYVLHYCFFSILSGIKPSLVKSSGKSKKS